MAAASCTHRAVGVQEGIEYWYYCDAGPDEEERCSIIHTSSEDPTQLSVARNGCFQPLGPASRHKHPGCEKQRGTVFSRLIRKKEAFEAVTAEFSHELRDLYESDNRFKDMQDIADTKSFQMVCYLLSNARYVWILTKKAQSRGNT